MLSPHFSVDMVFSAAVLEFILICGKSHMLFLIIMMCCKHMTYSELHSCI